MRGHTDTVTGIELSPDGSYLLSTAMDNTGIIVVFWLTCSFRECVLLYIHLPVNALPILNVA